MRRNDKKLAGVWSRMRVSEAAGMTEMDLRFVSRAKAGDGMPHWAMASSLVP